MAPPPGRAPHIGSARQSSRVFATAQQAATERPDERQERYIDREIDRRNGIEDSVAHPPRHQSQLRSKMAHAARPFPGRSPGGVDWRSVQSVNEPPVGRRHEHRRRTKAPSSGRRHRCSALASDRHSSHIVDDVRAQASPNANVIYARLVPGIIRLLSRPVRLIWRPRDGVQIRHAAA